MLPGAPPVEDGRAGAPYDVAGWTLPWQMGVRVDGIDKSFTLPILSRPWRARAAAPGRLWGEQKADYYVIDAPGTAA